MFEARAAYSPIAMETTASNYRLFSMRECDAGLLETKT